jgi:uncharacterized protein (TIGR03437 family)
MTRVLQAAFGLLLLVSMPILAQTPLTPGQLGVRNVPAGEAAALYAGAEGFYVDVPSDATRLVIMLTSSPPDALIDLYARLGEDVRLSAADTVLADYSSLGPAGEERIEVTAFSSPPLQPGRYFIAVRAGPENAEAFAFVSVSIDTLILGDVVEIVGSDFTGGEDNWLRNYPAPDPQVPGFTLGDPTAAIRTVRDTVGERSRYLEIEAQGEDYFVVGRQFLGNLALLGPDLRLEFDLRYRPPQSFANQDVEIKIFSRFTAYRWSSGRPSTEFQHYNVPLRAPAWQVISGSDSFEQVLENVLRIEIRASYGQPGGLTGIDNVKLFGRALPPDAPLRTSFDSSIGGWTRNFADAPFLTPRAFGVTSGDQETTIRLVATDGIPGGYLQVTDDDDDENQDFMLAPPQYLGDLSGLGPDAAFEFYRRHASPLNASRPVEVRIIGFGAAYRYVGAASGRDWTDYRAPLDSASWSLVAGDRSFEQVLRAVQRIEVSVDDTEGPEITGLDSFQLTGSPTEAPALSADPDSLSFVAVLGEEEPAPQLAQITSDGVDALWTARVAGGSSWVVLDRSDGATPGALVVRANPAGLGRGVFTDTVEVVWTGAPAPLAIDVRLTVVHPTTPRISSGGVVNSATFATNSMPGGELAGGMFVNIFGERFADSTVQAGVVPFPTSLGGTSATMGGLPMPLVYVSPTQIVGVTPQALTQVTGVAQGAPQAMADVVVEASGDGSPVETVRLKPVQPLIFTQNQAGTGLGAIQNVLDGGQVELNTFDTPARPGQVVTIYATGLGPTETPVPDGFAATGANRITGEPRVTIGGFTEEPSFAGLSPNSPHLYQVNATVPQDSPTGCSVTLRLSVDGVASNEVNLAVTSDGSPCR